MMPRAVFLLVVLAQVFKSGHQVYRDDDVGSQSHFLSGGTHVSTYIVAIIRDYDWHKRCVGTLVSELFILTAAQCAEFEIAELILGAYDILYKEKTQIRYYITQDNVINYPRFDPRTLNHDVAMIETPEKIKMTTFINVVPLPGANFEVSFGIKAYVTGWKKRLTGYSNTLSQTEVTILSRDKCIGYWPTARITANKICANNIQKELQVNHLLGGDCFDEPGSPLTLKDADILIGFLTETRCGSLLPEVFISVAKYKTWIDQIINSSIVLLSNSTSQDYAT